MFDFDMGKVWGYIIALLAACSGGLAGILRRSGKKKVQLASVLAEIFISAFAGLMAYWLSMELNVSGNIMGVICGMSGYAAPMVLDALQDTLEKGLSSTGKILKINGSKKEEGDKDAD